MRKSFLTELRGTVAKVDSKEPFADGQEGSRKIDRVPEARFTSPDLIPFPRFSGP